MDYVKVMSKAQLAAKLGISRETLRLKLKQIEGLDTGRRQVLLPKELVIIYKALDEGS